MQKDAFLEKKNCDLNVIIQFLESEHTTFKPTVAACLSLLHKEVLFGYIKSKAHLLKDPLIVASEAFLFLLPSYKWSYKAVQGKFLLHFSVILASFL